MEDRGIAQPVAVEEADALPGLPLPYFLPFALCHRVVSLSASCWTSAAGPGISLSPSADQRIVQGEHNLMPGPFRGTAGFFPAVGVTVAAGELESLGRSG
jgi:hypothetical protein